MVSRSPAGRAPAPGPAAADGADLEQGERDAARVAAGRDPADPLHTASLAEAADLLADRPIPLPGGGPGVGATHVAERTEGIALRPLGTAGEELAREARAARRVPGVSRAVLPSREHAIDPDSVPGHRFATAAAQLRHNGLTYQPGQRVPVNFKAYSQLVPVAGIIADPWDRLPEAPEPDAPKPEPKQV